MKKLISAAMGVMTLACALSMPANAVPEQKLPFDLTAPENVTMTDLNGVDSENTIEIHYSQNNSMSNWSKRKDDDYETVMKELNDMGYDDLWIQTQIDWSIDSQDDWHVNDYWLTEGYDENYTQHLGDWAYISQSYSHETTMEEWIFRGMGNIEDKEDTFWYGRHVDGDDYNGWKDVLKEDQYEVVKGDGESHAKIDLTKHTIYARVRYIAVIRPISDDNAKNVVIPSDWSEVASVGKDSEKSEPVKAGDLAAPVISDLKYTDKDFNGFPVISIKLSVDEILSKQLTQVNGTQGGISLIVEAKLQNKENWVELQGDWRITAGDMEIDLQNLAEAEGKIEKDTPIELRAKYVCSQPDVEEINSDWSEILTFGSQDMEVKKEDTVESAAEQSESSLTDSAVQKTAEKEDKCPICGFCPQPLGLCIFIWIAIVVVIIVIVAVIIIARKKKSEKKSS